MWKFPRNMYNLTHKYLHDCVYCIRTQFNVAHSECISTKSWNVTKMKLIRFTDLSTIRRSNVGIILSFHYGWGPQRLRSISDTPHRHLGSEKTKGCESWLASRMYCIIADILPHFLCVDMTMMTCRHHPVSFDMVYAPFYLCDVMTGEGVSMYFRFFFFSNCVTCACDADHVLVARETTRWIVIWTFCRYISSKFIGNHYPEAVMISHYSHYLLVPFV